MDQGDDNMSPDNLEDDKYPHNDDEDVGRRSRTPTGPSQPSQIDSPDNIDFFEDNGENTESLDMRGGNMTACNRNSSKDSHELEEFPGNTTSLLQSTANPHQVKIENAGGEILHLSQDA